LHSELLAKLLSESDTRNTKKRRETGWIGFNRIDKTDSKGRGKLPEINFEGIVPSPLALNL
jgi:hypothetical protein